MSVVTVALVAGACQCMSVEQWIWSRNNYLGWQVTLCVSHCTQFAPARLTEGGTLLLLAACYSLPTRLYVHLVMLVSINEEL